MNFDQDTYRRKRSKDEAADLARARQWTEQCKRDGRIVYEGEYDPSLVKFSINDGGVPANWLFIVDADDHRVGDWYLWQPAREAVTG